MPCIGSDTKRMMKTARKGSDSDTNCITPRHLRKYVHLRSELTPVDKGEGIKRCMAHLGASIEDVVVFGDGSNDVCMFLPEWTSVAMGNAIDELKQRADYVTTNVDDDGIWNACVHLGFIEA